MISRRDFVLACTAGALTGSQMAASPSGPARSELSFERDWLFGGQADEDALQRRFDDSGFRRITLPHCVAKLSWQEWNPASWEKVCIYRRHFPFRPEYRNRRVFLQFDGVMTGAAPCLNGHALPGHAGGYLPFRYEITDWLEQGDNVLAVEVDSRWQNVPPEGSPKGPSSIDYLEPGGIVRGVRLYAVPPAFVADVFAKPVDVLDSKRRVEVLCTIDSVHAGETLAVESKLLDASHVLARARQNVTIGKAGLTQAALTLEQPGNVTLWDMDHPQLYQVVTTIFVHGKAVHDYRVRIGFREAKFEVDGFRLNGKRLQIFGLNRHELYPYVGGAMPRRVLRRDAEILRRDFNCNMVRCSHYPQSEAFLEACDELGLMVWEEMPGWQYLGDETWRQLALRDVGDMVRRDRNHPAVIVWGVRINESRNDPDFYRQTKEAARALDDSRPASGSMTPSSTQNWQTEWHQDVFAFDDYHSASDGSVAIREPLPGVPYMLAEAVGQFNYATGRGFGTIYRRTADMAVQQAQGLRHAQAHDRGMGFSRCSGVVAWCAFDYGSLVNSYRGVKYPGIADAFRIPKLGAGFYQAQVSPEVRPVIAPDFYWDFGEATPQGPGKNAAIFSNCDRLEIFIGSRRRAVALPDRAAFPHLQFPPFFCDLSVDGPTRAELRIDGYAGGRLVLSRSFSADRARDQFLLQADDLELDGDGADATRLMFTTADRFGAPRPYGAGDVSFELNGPGEIIGDNPFSLAGSGGMGAVWVKTRPESSGRILVTATHSSLGGKSLEIKVRRVV